MITIEEVERVFETHPWIKPPKHIILVLEPVEMIDKKYGLLLFRGLQPSWRRDTIVLVAPLATEETVIHETLHTYGFGETVTHLFSKPLLNFRKTIPPIIKRRVKYKECHYCEEFKIVHTKYKDKMKHYVLVEYK